jgi:C4-dicarboxylate transporter DctM subunit
VGLNAYIVFGMVKNIPLPTIFKGILPFVVTIVICIALFIAFPNIALFLPSLMK